MVRPFCPFDGLWNHTGGNKKKQVYLKTMKRKHYLVRKEHHLFRAGTNSYHIAQKTRKPKGLLQASVQYSWKMHPSFLMGQKWGRTSFRRRIRIRCGIFVTIFFVNDIIRGRTPKRQRRLLSDWLIIFLVPRFLKRARQWKIHQASRTSNLHTISSPEPARIYGQRDRNATGSGIIKNRMPLFRLPVF